MSPRAGRVCPARPSGPNPRGAPAGVGVVPGNHDAYGAAAALHRDRHWLPYMSGDAQEGRNSAGAFPYLRRRGPVALIGVSTAIATPPFMATGMAGEVPVACVAGTRADVRKENVVCMCII